MLVCNQSVEPVRNCRELNVTVQVFENCGAYISFIPWIIRDFIDFSGKIIQVQSQGSNYFETSNPVNCSVTSYYYEVPEKDQNAPEQNFTALIMN